MSALKQKTVAVNAHAALAAAIIANLEPKMKNTEFRVIDRISERKPGEILAGVQIPSFLPGSDSVQVITVGSKMLDRDATTAERSAQWQTIRNENATPEEIGEQLGGAQSYLIVPERGLNDVKLSLAERTMELSEAETAEEQVVILKDIVSLYKSVFA